MQTSRNPKVLNRTLKYKLQPIHDKIANVEDLQEQYSERVNGWKNQEAELINHAEDDFGEYNESREELLKKIDDSNDNLTILINNQLYNPNRASGGGEEEPPIEEETKYINDKIIKACCYGFVTNGEDKSIFGITGKGITVGNTGTGETDEFEFMNPSNDEHTFPSFYINDIVKVDSHNALIATNNGVISYNFDDGSYEIYDDTHGLPSKEINCIVKVTNTPRGSVCGYLAGTSKGVAFSPTGERWIQIDESFNLAVTALSSVNYIDTPQDYVFVGTSYGIYMLDMKEVLDNNDREIHYLSEITKMLPNNYIYGISYNETDDILAIATTGGCLIVWNIINHIKNSSISIEKIVITSRNGINGTSCYSVLFTATGTLIIGTSNGLNITSDYSTFESITRNKTVANKTLNSHICNKIIRRRIKKRNNKKT